MRKETSKKVYIVERTLYDQYSTRTAVFDSYKKAKKEYNELLKIWEQDFKDQGLYTNWDYSTYDYWHLELYETTIL